MMRFYNQQHRFYCGVDLHTRTLSLCVLDSAGQTVLARTLGAGPDDFLQAVTPFRDGLAVACECMFAWYWLADLCHEQQIPFVLGHALYMKAIHGGKAKNDRIDAEKIARLLRGGNLPVAYVYPKAMRATRDLLRRRTFLVRRRAELLAHVVERGGLKNAVRRVQSYLDQAVAALQVLPKSAARETLEEIPRAVAEHVATLG